MPSFSTVYRAIVMLAIMGILVKGWQVYGLTGEQLRTLALRAIELANTALKDTDPVGAEATVVVGARNENSAFAPVQAPITIQTPPVNSDVALAPPPNSSLSVALNDGSVNTSQPTQLVAPSSTVTDRLPALLTRLEELGGVEPQLVVWGNSGQLFRFCCRATWSDTPNYTRHFEAIAPEPLAAVENVLAKLESWRTAQNGANRLR